ncbi:MAG: hypothetical protein ABI772_02045 [Bacteroidota bacterium]
MKQVTFKVLITVALLSLIVFSMPSCLNDKADDITPNCDSSYFVMSIKPIFIINCYDPDNNGSCHNENAASERGNYSVYDAKADGIQSRLDKMKIRLNLPVTDPEHMPLSKVLTIDDLKTLNDWLDAGGHYCR